MDIERLQTAISEKDTSVALLELQDERLCPEKKYHVEKLQKEKLKLTKELKTKVKTKHIKV